MYLQPSWCTPFRRAQISLGFTSLKTFLRIASGPLESDGTVNRLSRGPRPGRQSGS
jgi:hypothetical protein